MKNKNFHIRLDEQHYEMIKAVAEKQGASMASFFRTAALDKAREIANETDTDAD